MVEKLENLSSTDSLKESVLRLKRETGTKIFLGLPTLNEENTIGGVITSYNLEAVVDEIAVVDSGSIDKTPIICRNLGVPLIQSKEYLANLNINPDEIERGKGLNLWIGLLEAKRRGCDVVVFLDTDKQNPSPDDLLKLTHTLLENSNLVLVKALYTRETKLMGQIIKGGRVTRFTVRPLLKIFFPELNHISQPINGNVALKTDWFLDVPLSVKYGADLEILIHAVMKGGLVSQVDCGVFIQEGKSDDALERMAEEYIRVILELAKHYGRIEGQPHFLNTKQLPPISTFL